MARKIRVAKEYFLSNSTFSRLPKTQREWNSIVQAFADTQQIGAFTPTVTGFSSDPSGLSAVWRREWNIVHIHFGAGALGTSNATTFIITNLPDEITPAAKVWTTWTGPASDNSGTTFHSGTAEVTINGTVELWPGFDDTGWAATGSKGWALAGDECYFSYNLYDKVT